MATYLAPDVYVEEVDSGNQPIEGVSTSISGFVGMAVRGPVSGVPQLVTGFQQFRQIYGGYFDFGPTFLGYNALPRAVEGFFTNLGQLLYVVRVAPASATAASTTALGGLVTRLQMNTSTDLPLQHTLATTTLRGIQVGTKLQLRMIKNGIVTDSPVLNVQTVGRNTGLITVNPAISTTVVFEANYTTVFTDADGLHPDGTTTALATPTSARPPSFDITARDPGSWGANAVIRAMHTSAARSPLDVFVSGAVDNNKIQLKSAAGFYVNAWVEIDRGNTKMYRKVAAVNGPVLTLLGPAMAAGDVAPQAPATTTIVSTCEFNLTISYDVVNEPFSGLTIENVPGRYYYDIIHNGSSLIDVSALPAATPGQPFLFPSGGDGQSVLLDTGGSDGTAAPLPSDYVGQDNGPGQRTGIQALLDIDAISLVAAPGITDQVTQNALIDQCEALKFRFAILDPAPKAGNLAPDMNDIQAQRQLYDTKYAAIYYPRIMLYDLLSNQTIARPPSGHIVGIMARVDEQRGVHKAPANEVIAGITDLELIINKAEQEVLNPEPNNINVLRDFRPNGRGLRVWGARCITSDDEWKYINVRRLFIFIEKSIEVGTQWAVFEPNDYRLWARISQSVSQFLTRVWRDGALMGTKPEEAYFVKCDATTMTQDDIDNGRLIMIVGIAPVKPAEFVIIRIAQWDGGSSVQEL
jgi:phage tail sheath protein FI